MDLIATAKSMSAASTLFDRSIQQGWLRAADVEDRLRKCPGRSGNRRLRLLLGQLGDGAAAQSERMLHELLRRAGIRGWTGNYEVTVSGQVIAVIDVAFEAEMVAVELDGYAFHSDAARFRRDRSRQNQLTELGWTVLRFTWADLTERPAYVATTIANVLRRDR
jgi:very-short-patch-repair endonuclease